MPYTLGFHHLQVWLERCLSLDLGLLTCFKLGRMKKNFVKVLAEDTYMLALPQG